ncbi:hypothetical protein TWF694_002788 [Orbilia ellipsospora]|uniref:Monopolin complex subunit Csm1/Pcs1 C-terminal domain-containing protein n=1 Tax=Orbilia ellipsospora TaxID=2528407 RepID=A0AAV9X1Y5_9PEZI
MPPKKATKQTLASHIVSSSEEEIDTAGNRAASIETSTIKKTRGRPRKQTSAASSQATFDRDDIPPLIAETVSKKHANTGVAGSKLQQDHLVPSVGAGKPKTGQKKQPKNKNKLHDPGEGSEAIAAPIGGSKLTKNPIAPTTRPSNPSGRGRKTAGQSLEIPETQVVEDPGSISEDCDSIMFSNEENKLTASANDKTAKARQRKESKNVDVDAVVEELAQLRIRYEKLRYLKTEEADLIQDEQIQALQNQDKASQRIIENLKSELKSRVINFQQLQEKDRRIRELEEQQSLMEHKIERLLQDHAILSAKLETARNSTKTPLNNTKTTGAVVGHTKEFSHHKDNLYSDLCGLLVLNVKTDEDGGIEYDCLSTGKNGALHFKLQLDGEDEEDENEDDDGPYFTYNPMLERGRDERLIAVLPPIFRDEMNFKRTRGVDFYLQLMQSLQS